jgi:predicted metal-dependent hydrolase
MPPKSATPRNISITVRNLKFNRDTVAERWWLGKEPVPTAFFNALSCTFPQGERFFMDAVRHYRDAAPGPLQAQIRDFIGQEAVHSREHAAFNDLAEQAGYDVAALEHRVKRVLDAVRRLGPARQLAATCALEHFTAILAHALLDRDCRDLDGAPDGARQLWRWHAMEEIEHKAVAFDTYLVATAGWSRARRYLLRVHAMIIATTTLFMVIGRNMGDLYRADGIKGWRTTRRTMSYLFGRDGILRPAFRPYLTYFRPGFHPWQHDDRALLAKTAGLYPLEAQI